MPAGAGIPVAVINRGARRMNSIQSLAAAVAFAIAPTASAERIDLVIAGQSLTLDSSGAFVGATLTLVGPDGTAWRQQLDATRPAVFQVPARALFDGSYQYRVDFVASAPGAAVASGRGDHDGRNPTSVPGARAPAALTGSFLLAAGRVRAPARDGSGGHFDAGAAKDAVVPDDQIVQGSLCVGLACVNGESFGSDTVRLKEDALRIHFEDTSTGTFPGNDWRIGINDSADGGVSRFYVEDATAARILFSVAAGAPENSLVIDSQGRIGLRTAAPGLDAHVVSSDTPGLRLEQSNVGGFTAQTWDVAGNESNFFIRDLTGGSRLPFRIRPGAPTSSIDIAASGNVGIGTASPGVKLDVALGSPIATPATALRVFNATYADGPQETRFEVDSNGNVFARGTISQLSSRSAKHGFAPIDADWLLARVRALPMLTWSYLASEDKHVGPVAEDFHRAFGLGASDSMIAPSDLAGVALAAVQALQQEIDARDRRIETLEQRLARIEAQLAD